MGQMLRIVFGMMAVLMLAGPTSAQTPEADALFAQAKSFHDGVEVTQDLPLARSLYEAAVEAGSIDAKVNLAYMYFVGEGVATDYKIARRLYTDAAKAGDKDAAKNLAFMDKQRLGLSRAPKPAPVKTVKTIMPVKTALPAAAAVPVPYPVMRVATNPPTRSYQRLAEITPATVPPKPAQITAPSTEVTQYSAANVFAAIFLFAGLIGVSCGWAWELWQRHKRREYRALTQQFFEANRRTLREIYIRYPERDRRISNRESPLAVMLSVMMVRHVLARSGVSDDSLRKSEFNEALAAPLPRGLSTAITQAVKQQPAKARHICAGLLPELMDLIGSDIRAFDVEHTAQMPEPVSFRAPRRHPRRIGWQPKVVAS